MSVKVEDLMQLPCLRGARVLGGHGGLQKTVSSVSVLEYSLVNDLQKNIYDNIDFYGNEIVITAFANVKDNVTEQCINVQRLADVGEVGMILYYVGIIMPSVGQQLIDLANQLDFVLICMPENRLDLPYSEVISEVMEAIILDQMTNTRFQNDILERVSRLPAYQRSIDTVLRMLCDRVRATIVLADASLNILNCVSWPRTFTVNSAELIQLEPPEPGMSSYQAELGKEKIWVHKLGITTSQGVKLKLFVLRHGSALKPDAVRQIGEVLQLSVNLWSAGHGKEILPELVQAILQDEPIKMRRIAEVYRVDIASVRNMWVITPLMPSDNPSRRDQEERVMLAAVSVELRDICKTVIADIYNKSIVVFMQDPPAGYDAVTIANDVLERLTAAGAAVSITLCLNHDTATQMQNAFLLNRDVLSAARIVYPGRRLFVQQDLAFVKQCLDILNQGVAQVEQHTAVLNILSRERSSRHDLSETLTIYLLDANESVAKTAEYMYLHKNTIKYRLRKMAEYLGFPIGQMPASFALYIAAALERILHASKDLQAEPNHLSK